MLLTFVLALQSSILTDGRLAAHQDFDYSLKQITEVCAAESQISGVPFSVDSKVRDLKVDLFVEDKPIGETMDKVAKVLNCEWKPYQGGYRLEMDVPHINRERNFNTAEDEVNRRQAETLIWACEYCAKVTPLDKKADKRFGLLSAERRNETLKPFQEEWQAAEKGTDLVRKAKARAEYNAMSTAAGNWQMTSLGRALLQLDKAGMDQFWKGAPLVASSFPGAKIKLDSSEATTRFVFNTSSTEGGAKPAEPDLFYLLRYRPETGRLQSSLNVYVAQPKEFGGGVSSSRTGAPFSGSSSNNEVPNELKSMPFYKGLEPWMKSEEVGKAFPQMVKMDTKTWPSPWSISRRRLGDHLRWFHLATGIPVVAQADRSCLWNWVILNRPYADAKTYLQTLMDDTGTYCMADNGFLLARNYRYWSHRRHEAPEQVWRMAESEKKPFSMMQLFKLAGAFRYDQLQTEDIGYPLSTIDTTQVSYAYDSLNVLARLSKDQVAAAMSPNGFSIADLGPDLGLAATDTIAKLVCETGSCSYEMARVIVSDGLSNEALQRMRVRITSTDYKEWIRYINEIKEGNQVIQKSGQERYPVTQFTVAFGLSGDQSVSQSFNLNK